MSINDVFCEALPTRSDCEDGSTAPLVDCSNVGDQLFDFCIENNDGLVQDPLASAFTLIDGDFERSVCADDEGPQPISAEAACAIEAARIGGRGIPVVEVFEPGHECTCDQIESDEYSVLYELRCVSKCEYSSLGRYVHESSIYRRFLASENESNEIETRIVEQQTCVTYPDPLDTSTSQTACLKVADGFDMVVNGESCPHAGSGACGRDLVDCSAIEGGQIFDFCVLPENGFIEDPSVSPFFFVDSEMVWDTCPETEAVESMPTEAPEMDSEVTPTASPTATPVDDTDPGVDPTVEGNGSSSVKNTGLAALSMSLLCCLWMFYA